MYSLNVSTPPEVQTIVEELQSALEGFTVRESPGIVLKRLDPEDRTATGIEPFSELVRRARAALDGAPACEARVSGIDCFWDPPSGTAPVVYLAVDSPGLHELHRRCCEVFAPVPLLEGEDYVPHVTVGRGGDPAIARRLVDREIEPLTWTVDEVALYDARHGEPVRRFSLPFTG